MLDLVLKNGKIVTPEKIIRGNIAIKDGKIHGLLSPDLNIQAKEIIDVEGGVITPGAIDSHVHIPKKEGDHRGDFFTEGRAALFGGTTTVMEFIKGGDSLRETFVREKEAIHELTPLDYTFHGVILQERELEDIAPLHEEGLVSFKHIMADCNGGRGLPLHIQYRSFQEISRVGSIAVVHAENEDIQNYMKQMLQSKGRTDPMAHAESRTVFSEVEAISRSILLVEETGAALHVFHVSSAWGAQLIQDAISRGLPVSGETCPHYLCFTRDDVKTRGPFVQINPSLKFEEDRVGLWNAIQKGDLSMVVSDHYAPLKAEKEKGWNNIWPVEGGVPGIETRTLFLLSEGVEKGRLKWEDFVALTAKNPAKQFGIYPRKGSLETGADADLVVWERTEGTFMSSENLHQTADWTPFDKIPITWRPSRTYLRGRLVIENDRFLGFKGYGEFIPGKGIRKEE